jgi:hypothetical protein
MLINPSDQEPVIFVTRASLHVTMYNYRICPALLIDNISGYINSLLVLRIQPLIYVCNNCKNIYECNIVNFLVFIDLKPTGIIIIMVYNNFKYAFRVAEFPTLNTTRISLSYSETPESSLHSYIPFLKDAFQH